ncbi:hypothetical protein GH5_07537 [Leishmania sp. Ghana 2012 LV757]|uniref:hypothetical protein n=1 Tax=Leishmania sp. Ghana 2012 LV757 TaxID=2803181 RepID=UPI001B74A387|nr:hypothetical protein GH5_07537 [Leishmania sp. Ghana 2012 LV757]
MPLITCLSSAAWMAEHTGMADAAVCSVAHTRAMQPAPAPSLLSSASPRRMPTRSPSPSLLRFLKSLYLSHRVVQSRMHPGPRHLWRRRQLPLFFCDGVHL